MTHALSPKPTRLSHAIAICIISGLALFGLSPNVCAADGEVFTVQLPTPVVQAGASIESKVQISSIPGWKWNKEYPARINFSAEGPVSVSPAQLSKENGKIQVVDTNAVLPLQLEGTASGEATVLMKASFSICNAESCKVFRNKEFRFTVKVQ